MKKQKKNKKIVLVAEFAYNSQITLFGLVRNERLGDNFLYIAQLINKLALFAIMYLVFDLGHCSR